MRRVWGRGRPRYLSLVQDWDQTLVSPGAAEDRVQLLPSIARRQSSISLGFKRYCRSAELILCFMYSSSKQSIGRWSGGSWRSSYTMSKMMMVLNIIVHRRQDEVTSNLLVAQQLSRMRNGQE
jgi:hypothetical protein